MRAEVLSWCRREALFSPGAQVVCAVSGGADSMAMLCCLRELAAELSVYVRAAHFNHRLRGAESDGDEAFVRAFCAAEGIELVCGAPEKPARSEEEARKQRYAFLDSIPCDAVAIAHTAEDNLETLLQHLLRGSGLRGLGGTPPRRGRYVRPLLAVSHAQVREYLRARGTGWREDATNAEDSCQRNRLRHGALPALCAANRAAERNLARFCEKAARADEYFARQADALLASARAADAKSLPGGAGYALRSGQLVWMSEPLRQADPLILDMALHSLVEPVRDAEEKYIRLLAALVERGSGAVQLTDNVRFCGREGLLWREESDNNIRPQGEKADVPERAVSLPEGGDYPLPGGGTLQIRVVSACFEEKTQVVHKKDLKNQADYAKINLICPALRLRCRQPGDRFRPAGRGTDRELRKWMNEAGIPPRERDTLPLLAAGRQVLWVCGEGFADGLAPGPDTGQLLQVELENFGGIES